MIHNSIKKNVLDNLWLFGAIFIYIVLYFFFYPPIYAYRDESSYLAMAYVLREGKLFLDQLNIPMMMKVSANGHISPMYALGNSIALIPFTWFGINAVYLYGLFCHLAGVYVVGKLAQVLGVHSKWPRVLYLFFPAYVLYSRTIMSDVPVAVLFITGAWFYFRAQTSKYQSGIFFGLMILMKTAHVLYAFPFLLMLLIQAIKTKKSKNIMSFLFGFVPFCFLAALLNTILYGSPFLMGYSANFTGIVTTAPGGAFSLQNFQQHGSFYLKSLLIVYPAMALFAFFSRKIWRAELLFTALLIIVFYSFWGFLDTFPTDYARLAFATRYLFPIIAILIIGYGDFLESFLSRMPKNLRVIVVSFMALGLLILCSAVHQQHQLRLNEQFALKQAIYESTAEGDTVFYDRNSAELVQIGWGERDYREYRGIDRFLEKSQAEDVARPFYLVKRDIRYGAALSQNVTDDDLNQMKTKFAIQKVREEKNLVVFKLGSK